MQQSVSEACPFSRPAITSQDFVSQAISLFGCLILAVVAAKTYNQGLTGYAATMFSFAACTLANYIIYKIYRNWQVYLGYIIIAFSFLYMFLLASGGEDDTGLIWCMAYPMLVFPLLGARLGMTVMATLFICTCVILYMPEYVWTANQYSNNMRYRFTGAILYVSMFAYLMERSRAIATKQSEDAHEQLRLQARSDELTGMFNRRGVKEKIDLELHRVARDHTEMSLVLCDLDLFKNINDRYGHDVGDAALKHVSSILKDSIRVTDVAGRWGGEEFLIALPSTPLLDGYHLIERVRERIANERLLIDGKELKLSISCGICSTRFASRFDDLVKAADISLYEAKAQGRNCTRPVLSTAS